MKVIFHNYTNGKIGRKKDVDYSTCIRLLYLAQNVFDMSAENLVTVTCNDVKANCDCHVSTGVSIHKEANSRMIQHIVEVSETY